MNPSVSNHSANCPGVCELTYQPGAVAKKSGNGCLSGHHVTNIVSRHLIKSNHKGDSKRLNQQHEDCTANLKALNLISNLGTFLANGIFRLPQHLHLKMRRRRRRRGKNLRKAPKVQIQRKMIRRIMANTDRKSDAIEKVSGPVGLKHKFADWVSQNETGHMLACAACFICSKT